MCPPSGAPEGRPVDQGGCPIPSSIEIRQQAILDARIVREWAREEAAANNGLVAGHDFGAEYRERTQGRGR